MHIEILILIIFISSALTWKCGADSKAIKPKEIELPQNNLRNLKEVPFTSLNIYYDYTTLDKQKEGTAVMKNNIKSLLKEAKDLFKEIIKAKQLSDKLALGKTECDSSIEYSDIVKNTGVDAHMIIFPFIDSDENGNVLAYASACLQIKRRPIAGFIGFPIKALGFSADNWFTYYLSLVMHEITHVLVFSSNLFDGFVNENDELLSTSKTKQTVINGVTRTLLTTPKVVKIARMHFNCPSLEGVELEDQGGAGTAGSHWEARIMLSDYMIGSNYDEMVISDITLALFEDSGWYKVNYYTGGLFRFGKNQGCSFLNSMCLVSGKSQFKNEFCDSYQEDICTNGRSSRGFCYFKSGTSNLGGFQLADYCPVSRVPTDLNKYFNYNCKYGTVAYPSLGEVISDKSICFMINESSSKKSICYPYKCDFKKKKSKVTVSNQEIECPTDGGTKSLSSGSIECPKFTEICTTETPCYDIKSCIDNKSVSIASKSYDGKANSLELSLIIIMLYAILISI